MGRSPTYPQLHKNSDKEWVAFGETHTIDQLVEKFSTTRSAVNNRLFKARMHVGDPASQKNAARKTLGANLDEPTQHAPSVKLQIHNGCALVFGDAHYWPGDNPPAHRAIVRAVKKFNPDAVICNGDALDLAAVSRHPPIGWEKIPSVQEEIETAQDRLSEIQRAATKRTRWVWNLGNHDARFETRLAERAPEYAKVSGIHLYDHFPTWDRAWATWINDDVVIKHRFKGGDHAPFNNTMKSGVNMVTGHLHSAKVTPFTDYNGTRYGVDHGCLADTWSPKFNYCEENPRNWVSGFCLLTFLEGKLLMPELCTVWDKNHVQMRGHLIEV